MHLGGRTVAVKTIRADRLQDPTSIERFRIEARAAAQLDTPYVVRVIDTFEAENTQFIVMEYIRGTSLAEFVSDRPNGPAAPPLAPDEALRLLRQAAEGLYAAEVAAVVHRDIKPANLLLAKRDVGDRLVTEIRIADFVLPRFRTQPQRKMRRRR